MTAKANKKGLLMNSKGGIYTTLAAVLVIAVMSASMMQVLAMQDDVGVKIAGSAARDVKLAWVNARYLADEGIGRVLYAAASAGCTLPGPSSVSASALSTVFEILQKQNCTTEGFSCVGSPSAVTCNFTLKCESENGAATFADSVSVTKNVSASLDEFGVCNVDVTDA